MMLWCPAETESSQYLLVLESVEKMNQEMSEHSTMSYTVQRPT